MRNLINSVLFVNVTCVDAIVSVQVDEQGIPIWNLGNEGTKYEGQRFPRFVGVAAWKRANKQGWVNPFGEDEGLQVGLSFGGSKDQLSTHLRNREDLPLVDLLEPKAPKAPKVAKVAKAQPKAPKVAKATAKAAKATIDPKWRIDEEILEFFSEEFQKLGPLFLAIVHEDGRKHPKLAHRAGLQALSTEVREVATEDEKATIRSVTSSGYGSEQLLAEMTEYLEMLAEMPATSDEDEDDLFGDF